MAPIPLRLLSQGLASALSIGYTITYVAVLYLHKRARPTKSINKDNPGVIKSRIVLVTLATLLISSLTVYLGHPDHETWSASVIRILGLRFSWRPVSSALLLTVILFSGPLYEYLVADGRVMYLLSDLRDGLTHWTGIRNYIAGPLTEELVFRACIIPLHIYAAQPIGRIILCTPLYFGLAHIHHIYEKTRARPDHKLEACVISLVQFIYTTIFGWYASYLFIRTGSIWACTLVHSFCNAMGLPRVTGRVNGHWIHSVIYYSLLIGGALAFAANIETWTTAFHAYQPYSFS